MTDLKLIFELGKTVLSAFVGALFAYLFMQQSDRVKRQHERKVKHLKALRRLSFIANEHTDAISNNIYEIDCFIKAFNKAKQQEKMVVTPNRPRAIQYDGSVLHDLVNVDLVNETFSYFCTVERANGDIANFTRLFDLFLSAALAHHIDSKVYMANCEVIARGLTEVRKFLVDLQCKARRLFATTQLRLRKDNHWFRRLLRLSPRGRNEHQFHDWLKNELELVEKQSAEIRKKSLDEIQRISAG